MDAELLFWMRENRERLYHAALLACGPPPQKHHVVKSAVGDDYMITTYEYNAYINRAWEILWAQLPDKYKVTLKHYVSIFERQRQARELKEGYEAWLQKLS